MPKCKCKVLGLKLRNSTVIEFQSMSQDVLERILVSMSTDNREEWIRLL